MVCNYKDKLGNNIALIKKKTGKNIENAKKYPWQVLAYGYLSKSETSLSVESSGSTSYMSPGSSRLS